MPDPTTARARPEGVRTATLPSLIGSACPVEEIARLVDVTFERVGKVFRMIHRLMLFLAFLLLIPRSAVAIEVLWDTMSFDLSATPEPATLLLWGTSAAGLGLARRFRRRQQHAA